jgi:uncharacterized protein (TIGR03067 family)
MRRCILLAIATILGVSAVMAQEDLAKMEVAKLQGTWRVVSLEAGGQKAPEQSIKGVRFLIQGDNMSLSGKEKDLRTYRLDATAKPKTIDIPGDADKEFSKAIYELDGDTLKLCFSQSTKLDRPKSFDTAGTKYFCYTLKRDKP